MCGALHLGTYVARSVERAETHDPLVDLCSCDITLSSAGRLNEVTETGLILWP